MSDELLPLQNALVRVNQLQSIQPEQLFFNLFANLRVILCE